MVSGDFGCKVVVWKCNGNEISSVKGRVGKEIMIKRVEIKKGRR